MKFVRTISIVLGISVVVILLATLGLAYFDQHTSARAKVSGAIMYLQRVAVGALRDPCYEGKFVSIDRLRNVGVPEIDREAYVLRTEMKRVTPETIQVTVVLTDIYVNVLGRSTVIPQGATITFEYICTGQRAFSSRFVASTVPPKYLRLKHGLQ